MGDTTHTPLGRHKSASQLNVDDESGPTYTRSRSFSGSDKTSLSAGKYVSNSFFDYHSYRTTSMANFYYKHAKQEL